MSFNEKIEALRRRMDGGHQQQRAAGNDRQRSHIAQQLAASGLIIIHTISLFFNLIMTRRCFLILY